MVDELFRIKLSETFFEDMTMEEVRDKATELKKAGVTAWSIVPSEEGPARVDLVDEFNEKDKALYENYHKERIAAKREYTNAKRPLTEKYEARLSSSWQTYLNARESLMLELVKKLGEQRKEDPQQEL